MVRRYADLGMGRPITRRDVIHGLAAGAAAGAVPGGAWGRAAPYPPALTGLRGSHVGSFEAAHDLALEGVRFPLPSQPEDDLYDLIVVGGGLSGLAAAYFYRQQAGPAARILILENHDDFGGHARRNEFRAGARLMIGYGGSQSIDTPSAYSPVAKDLLDDLKIDVNRFHTAFDQGFYERLGLRNGIYFDRKTYGQDRLVIAEMGTPFLAATVFGDDVPLSWIDELPYPGNVRQALYALYTDDRDPLSGKTKEEKVSFLSGVSYNHYLTGVLGLDAGVIDLFQRGPHSFWGVGTDALSALECYRMEYPGFRGLGLEGAVERYFDPDVPETEPYIFHFPDGNASIARLLVRQLIPAVAEGNTMEDVVTAVFDYGALDRPDSPVRLRLDSTVVSVTHQGVPRTAEFVDVGYVRSGQVHRVRGRRCVLACWHAMIPHLCPELPAAQREALAYNVKTPLVYTNVLLRDWQAFQALGISYAYCPGSYHTSLELDFPVSLGDYRHSRTPQEPIILHMVHVPVRPGENMTAREQARAGRARLLATPFERIEYEIRSQLTGLLAPGGFDPARDIEAITVNRWPHGYSYEYNTLFDPDWPPGQAPHEIARAPFGRIAIANADAGASAYADSAIDQAWRAVGELLR